VPHLTVVGLPDTVVQESRERVMAAVKNGGLKLPIGKVTLNLAPAALCKQGPAYDLPIALGVPIASEQVFAESIGRAVIVGELSLD
jgi:magnesium chelatase family protein